MPGPTDMELFVVAIETEVVVYAKDKEAAERVARENVREIDSSAFDFRAHEHARGTKLPWGDDQIPLNQDDEDFRTLGEIQAGKAKE